MSRQVLSFKLVGGQEVVAEVLKEIKPNLINDTSTNQTVVYVIKRPHILQFQPLGNGNVGLAFIPWTLSNPDIDNLELPASSLIMKPFSPSSNVEKQYLEQTTGLSLATSM